MKKILLNFCIIICYFSFSQVPNIEWQKCFGGTGTDAAKSIKQTSDGGYISVGFTESIDGDVTLNHGGDDVWVQKVNIKGELEWQKCYGGSLDDRGRAIITTADGGYLISGMTSSNDGDVSGNHTSSSGYSDAWLFKINSKGAIQWQKCYGSIGSESAECVIQSIDGGYVFSGYCEVNNGDVSGNHGNWDIWCVKVNSNGNIQWQKSFGGTGEDRCHKIKATNDGGYIISGYTVSFNGDVVGNHGNKDVWILKLSSTGTLQWQKCFGGINIDEAQGLSLTADGGYIFAGSSFSSDGDVSFNNGNGDVWVVKINNKGILEWQKSYGGSNFDYAHEILQMSDGGYIITANTTSKDINVTGHHGSNDGWILKIDSYGTLIWQKCIGSSGYDDGNDIQITSDGGFIVAGYGAKNNGDVSGSHGGLYDAWLVKLNQIFNCNNFYITSNQYYSTKVNSGYTVNSLPIVAKSSSPVTYSWYFGNRKITDGANYTGTNTNQLTIHNTAYTQDDNINSYICYVSDVNGCVDTAYFSVDVCDGIISQPNNLSSSINSSAILKVSHSDPSATYQWRSDFGSGFQNITNTGQYSGSNTSTLVISNLSKINNNQFFYCSILSHCNSTQNSDTVKLVILDSTNSIFENQINELVLYPNPVSNEFKLQSSFLKHQYSYRIMNAVGKEIKTGEVKTLDDVINCEFLEEGIYFINVLGYKQIIKFIKN
jgi:hypothetical protein